MGEMKNTFKIMVRKPVEELGIDRKIYIRMDLGETVWEGVKWMHLAQIGTSGGLL
jgi:hypothetical protein